MLREVNSAQQNQHYAKSVETRVVYSEKRRFHLIVKFHK